MGAQGVGSRVQGLELGGWVSGFGFRVSGFGFRVSGFEKTEIDLEMSRTAATIGMLAVVTWFGVA